MKRMLDEPHKVLFAVLVLLVATVGGALAYRVILGTQDALPAFMDVAERTGQIAAVIVAGAKGEKWIKALRGVTDKPEAAS